MNYDNPSMRETDIVLSTQLLDFSVSESSLSQGSKVSSSLYISKHMGTHMEPMTKLAVILLGVSCLFLFYHLVYINFLMILNATSCDEGQHLNH